MKTHMKRVLIGAVAALMVMPVLVGNSFAHMHMDDDDMRGNMMYERGMHGGMGMMGGGMGSMGMMPMMGCGMGMMSMMGGMPPMMIQMLDLDDKQRAQIRDISRTQRKAQLDAMAAMMDTHDELATAYDKDEPDAKAIGKIYSKMFDKKRQMIEQSIDTRNKIRAVLNKEQKEKFDNMHRRGGMGMMGGGMMGQGGGMGMMQ